MTDKEVAMIPYFAHEGEMARMERANKRWFVAFLITLILLVATNAAWILYEAQYETYFVQQDVDTGNGNGNALVAGVGDINGQSEAGCENPGEEEQLPEPNEGVPDL